MKSTISVLYISTKTATIHFEPCEAGSLTPNYYGLGGFDMLPLSAQETEPTVTLEKTNSTNIAENIEINQEEKQAEPVVALQNATANSVFDVNDDDGKAICRVHPYQEELAPQSGCSLHRHHSFLRHLYSIENS